MAVAAAPGEERDGRREDSVPPLCRCYLYYSLRRDPDLRRCFLL
jgi:hypothetical protein